MGVAEADNMEKYKSYIQRRRVAPTPQETSLPAAMETGKEQSKQSQEDKYFNSESEASFTDSYTQSFGGFAGFEAESKKDSQKEESFRKSPLDNLSDEAYSAKGFSRSTESNRSYPGAHSTALRRTDPGIYRRLYGQSHGKSSYGSGSSYVSPYRSYGSNQAEIEDNRATVLAVKIIKQAVACFVILGVIVLMQQRTDMAEALAFIKKQLIEANIDPQTILSGVENAVKECTRFLGGSP